MATPAPATFVFPRPKGDDETQFGDSDFAKACITSEGNSCRKGRANFYKQVLLKKSLFKKSPHKNMSLYKSLLKKNLFKAKSLLR